VVKERDSGAGAWQKVFGRTMAENDGQKKITWLGRQFLILANMD